MSQIFDSKLWSYLVSLTIVFVVIYFTAPDINFKEEPVSQEIILNYQRPLEMWNEQELRAELKNLEASEIATGVSTSFLLERKQKIRGLLERRQVGGKTEENKEMSELKSYIERDSLKDIAQGKEKQKQEELKVSAENLVKVGQAGVTIYLTSNTPPKLLKEGLMKIAGYSEEKAERCVIKACENYLSKTNFKAAALSVAAASYTQTWLPEDTKMWVRYLFGFGIHLICFFLYLKLKS
jgi:hypothetical protein